MTTERALRVHAVVPAAGAGRRMGGPKALLDWSGEPLLVAHLHAALSAGCATATGVVRPDVGLALRELVKSPARLVESREDDDFGAAGSLRAFVRSFGASTGDPDNAIETWFAVAPVDVLPEAWQSLGQTLTRLRACVVEVDCVRPVHGGRRGHPVLVRAETFRRAYGAGGTAPRPLRDVLHDGGTRVVDVEVATAAVTSDLDTIADLAKARSESDRRGT